MVTETGCERGQFRCWNCRKCKPVGERAQLDRATRFLFFATDLFVGGAALSTRELCKACVTQRFIWAGLCLAAILVVVLFL